MQAIWNDRVIANSDATATMHGYAYFPRAAVRMDLLRPSPKTEPAPILQVAATSTWIAYNEWGGSNHYEGITGPGRNLYSSHLSTQRPWTRGFPFLPVGAPRIPLREPPRMGAAPRYPHMEWAYANGYSKKYTSAGWASYDRYFLRWAEGAIGI